MITLYSTECPKCKVLKKKLTEMNIDFTVSSDIDYLLSKGIKQAPVLDIDGNFMTFEDAIAWIKERGKDK